MKSICLWVAFVLGLPFFSFAQKNDYVWVFSLNNVIDFKNNPLQVDSLVVGEKIIINECASSVSDNNGNLRFYLSPQDQDLIYENRRHIDNQPRSTLKNAWGEVIENGDSIKTYSSISQCLLLPLLDTTDRYVFLSVWNTKPYPKEGQPARLYYSIIDGSANRGKGKVIQKNIPLSGSLFCQSIAAVRHANGKDWWILLHDAFGKGKLYKYLLTEKGFSPLFTQTGGKVFNPDSNVFFGLNVAGQFSVSSKGDKIFLATDNPTLLYDFDRCTGLLSLKAELAASNSTFSPDGNLLYTVNSFRNNNYIFFSYIQQYDLNAPDISQSVMNLDTFVLDKKNTSSSYYDLELGPDNKIYFASSLLSQYLRAIEKPDVRGKGCSFKDSVLKLNNQNKIGNGFLPNMPNFRLGAIEPKHFRRKDTTVCPGTRLELGDTGSADYVYSWHTDFPVADSTASVIIYPKKNSVIVRHTHCATAPCLMQTDTFVVFITPNPDYKISKSVIQVYDCPKQFVSIGTHNPKYTYTWNHDSTLKTGSVTLIPTENTTYVRTTFAPENRLCPIASDTFVIELNPRYFLFSSASKFDVCEGDSVKIGQTIRVDEKTSFFRWTPVSGLKETLSQVVWAAPSQTTRYLRTAYYKSDSCPYSFDTVTVRVIKKNIPPCTTVSRPDLYNKNRNFELYPNPANDWLVLTSPASEPIEVILYDLTGRELLKTIIHTKHQFDLRHLPEGVYLLHAPGSFSEKIVIVR